MLTGRLGGAESRLGNTDLGATGLSGGNARLTQLPVEPAVLPSSGRARLTQIAAEPVLLPAGAAARLTQLAAEPVLLPAGERVRLTQLTLEVLVQGGAVPLRALVGVGG